MSDPQTVNTITISAKDHGRANRLLLGPEWKDRHGYAGLPSRKIFRFQSREDRDEVSAKFTEMGIKHRLDNPFDGPDPW